MSKLKLADVKQKADSIIGDPRRIDLSISTFRQIIENNNLYVDKTRFIEDFINSPSTVQLIARQRRLGKSLNMDMLRAFLTDTEDNRALFKGLYIEHSSVWEQLGSAPCFVFDFKGLTVESYKKQIHQRVCDYMRKYIADGLSIDAEVTKYSAYIAAGADDTTGFGSLIDLVFEVTGKQSYILIDEYDKLLMDNRNSKEYESIQTYETALLSAALKGNAHLKKGLLTGVTRISHEGMLSGLNNLTTFDVFNDSTYTADYGFTEEEIDALNKVFNFDKAELKSWYNGIRIKGTPIYNTYSVMSYLNSGIYESYWGNSGTLDLIQGLITPERKKIIANLLNGETAIVPVVDKISLRQINNDFAFYSLLVQAGYLSIGLYTGTTTSEVTVPNKELKLVWQNYILTIVYQAKTGLITMLDNTDDLEQLGYDIQDYLSDSLSYYDITDDKTAGERKTKERAYHVFVLGLMSAYRDTHYSKPLSNRESGDGRYDVLFMRPESNYIFEFKSCADTDNLDEQASAALAQIDEKRYFAEVPRNKPLIKVGMAFCGKQCEVKCGKIVRDAPSATAQ